MVLVLSFIDVINHINYFVNIEPALHPRYKSCLVVVNNLLMYCWSQLANILLRIFASMFIREIGLLFSGVSIWFWNQGNAGFIERVW